MFKIKVYSCICRNRNGEFTQSIIIGKMLEYKMNKKLLLFKRRNLEILIKADHYRIYSMKHQIVVIGGGIAGVAACVELLELGLSDILLIEATDHLGGRIRTVPFRNILLISSISPLLLLILTGNILIFGNFFWTKNILHGSNFDNFYLFYKRGTFY